MHNRIFIILLVMLALSIGCITTSTPAVVGPPKPAPPALICELHDVQLDFPTYQELMAWLKVEPSQLCEARDCVERLSNLGECARQQGYDMWVVLMTAEDGDGHAIAVFPTKDKDIIFIEPNIKGNLQIKERYRLHKYRQEIRRCQKYFFIG